jgi:hypothetical protein
MYIKTVSEMLWLLMKYIYIYIYMKQKMVDHICATKCGIIECYSMDDFSKCGLVRGYPSLGTT